MPTLRCCWYGPFFVLSFITLSCAAVITWTITLDCHFYQVLYPVAVHDETNLDDDDPSSDDNAVVMVVQKQLPNGASSTIQIQPHKLSTNTNTTATFGIGLWSVEQVDFDTGNGHCVAWDGHALFLETPDWNSGVHVARAASIVVSVLGLVVHLLAGFATCGTIPRRLQRSLTAAMVLNACLTPLLYLFQSSQPCAADDALECRFGFSAKIGLVAMPLWLVGAVGFALMQVQYSEDGTPLRLLFNDSTLSHNPIADDAVAALEAEIMASAATARPATLVPHDDSDGVYRDPSDGVYRDPSDGGGVYRDGSNTSPHPHNLFHDLALIEELQTPHINQQNNEASDPVFSARSVLLADGSSLETYQEVVFEATSTVTPSTTATIPPSPFVMELPPSLPLSLPHDEEQPPPPLEEVQPQPPPLSPPEVPSTPSTTTTTAAVPVSSLPSSSHEQDDSLPPLPPTASNRRRTLLEWATTTTTTSSTSNVLDVSQQSSANQSVITLEAPSPINPRRILEETEDDQSQVQSLAKGTF